MLKSKSVDKLLSKFTKLRDELLQTAERADADAATLTSEIETLRARRGGAKIEAKRAREAAERIDSMFSV